MSLLEDSLRSLVCRLLKLFLSFHSVFFCLGKVKFDYEPGNLKRRQTSSVVIISTVFNASRYIFIYNIINRTILFYFIFMIEGNLKM